MASREKKKKKKQSPESTPNPSLPDDLLLSCFARVSRLYYPTLSFVSKSYRSLIASPELYKTRSLLNHTESCLYVCLEFPPDLNQRWFTLSRKPNRALTNITKKKSRGYVLAPVPVHNSPRTPSSGLVAVGSNIYAIGGSIRYESDSSSCVSVLDCRSHTWHEAPSLRMERYKPAANVVDGKIYVAGTLDSSYWMEVFDPKTQSWEPVVSPLTERCGKIIYNSTVVKGDIYLFGHEGMAYKPKEDKWIAITEESMDFKTGWVWNSYYCVIDNVMFCYRSRAILWYDSEVRDWIELKGLRGLPKFGSRSTVKLADYGGKLVVFWDKQVPSSGYKDKMIWCVEISLEKHNSGEIWGNVEWFDAVLTVPKSYKFVSAISATV